MKSIYDIESVVSNTYSIIGRTVLKLNVVKDSLTKPITDMKEEKKASESQLKALKQAIKSMDSLLYGFEYDYDKGCFLILPRDLEKEMIDAIKLNALGSDEDKISVVWSEVRAKIRKNTRKALRCDAISKHLGSKHVLRQIVVVELSDGESMEFNPLTARMLIRLTHSYYRELVKRYNYVLRRERFTPPLLLG